MNIRKEWLVYLGAVTGATFAVFAALVVGVAIGMSSASTGSPDLAGNRKPANPQTIAVLPTFPVDLQFQ